METVCLPINAPQWLDFVSSHSCSTVFHHPSWAKFLAECYNYRPFIFAAIDEEGKIAAGLPMEEVQSPLTGKRWVSLPFTDACVPLSDELGALEMLVEALSELGRKKLIPRIEIHSLIPNNVMVHQSASFAWNRVPLARESELVFKKFNKSRVREPINQARRRGVRIHWCTTNSEQMTFYKLFAETHHRLGVPVQPKRFFKLLWDRIIEKGFGFTLLAYKDDIPIAGAIFLHYGKILIAKYNGSDSRYWNLRPNDLLYWTAMQWGCENGFEWFDFGRTEFSNTALRDFKKGWGAQETELCYSTISPDPPRQSNGRVKDALGMVIRNSPLFVCRLIGELLYGHFA